MILKFRLQLLKEANNVTNEQIANFINIPERDYTNIECGICEPNISIIIKLADFFDVSLDYIVGRSDEPTLF